MGKALYRKYRSKTLDDVIGQSHITDTLKNAIAKNTVSHAYLFTGPRGVGKTSVARLLAHAINELPYGDEENHLDIIEIDAASNRRIDEIRDLRDKVHIAPTSAKYKIYIIDEVHMLTREAFNALLKTLEEPPAHAIFILATTELHKVPETIVSRTQNFTFRSVDLDAVAQHLKIIANNEKILITDEALKLLAVHGQGSFRDSISMLDQIAGFSDIEITDTDVASLLGVPRNENLDTLIASITNQDINEIFDCLRSMREAGVQSFQIARAIISILRESLASNTSPMSPNRTIQVMKELLPLSGSGNSFESLEVALLSTFSVSEEAIISNKAVTQNVSKITNPAAKPKPKHEETIKAAADQKIDKKPENNEPEINTVKAVDNTDKWQTLISSMKESHSTLHGFLRMARVEETEEDITLYFKFDFHKKQLSTPKNYAIIEKAVTDSYGKYQKIILEVDQLNRDEIDSPIKAALNKTNVDLENVSSIFGGAELLES